MSERLAVYPGSFDPITRGHEDIVRRALHFCDRVIVAVAHRRTQAKSGLFAVHERLDLIRSVFADEPRVIITDFTGLLVDFARGMDVRMIIRGLRAVSDFEYEFQMALMNRRLNRDIQTVFLMTDYKWMYLSSTIVKEAAKHGANIKGMIPDAIVPHLYARFAELDAAGRS